MSQITKNFPTISEITPTMSIDVFVLGKFEYTINTLEQLGNIRLWALQNGMTNDIEFHYEDDVITMDGRGNLSDFPFDVIGKQLIAMTKFNRNNTLSLQYIKK